MRKTPIAQRHECRCFIWNTFVLALSGDSDNWLGRREAQSEDDWVLCKRQNKRLLFRFSWGRMERGVGENTYRSSREQSRRRWHGVECSTTRLGVGWRFMTSFSLYLSVKSGVTQRVPEKCGQVRCLFENFECIFKNSFKEHLTVDFHWQSARVVFMSEMLSNYYHLSRMSFLVHEK